MNPFASPEQIERAVKVQQVRRNEMKNAAREARRAKKRKDSAKQREWQLAYNARRRQERTLPLEARIKREREAMVKCECRCGKPFLRRVGSAIDTCCECALKGLPPLAERYTAGHPLAGGER